MLASLSQSESIVLVVDLVDDLKLNGVGTVNVSYSHNINKLGWR